MSIGSGIVFVTTYVALSESDDFRGKFCYNLLHADGHILCCICLFFGASLSQNYQNNSPKSCSLSTN